MYIQYRRSEERTHMPKEQATMSYFDLRNCPPLITCKQVELAGIAPERTVRDWCAKDRIKAVKLGRCWLISRDSLLTQLGI